MNSHRAGSAVLLACGIVLVFAGLSSAQGFSLVGLVASAAAIAALLNAGGVWFGGAARADASIVLFTPALTIGAGPLAGRPIADLFAADMHDDLAVHCREALAGVPSRFTCGSGAARATFAAAPVRDADGRIIYGLLLSGALVSGAGGLLSA